MSIGVNRTLRDTALNLWRNIQYALAAVLTVGVSLTLVGSALIAKQGVSNATSQWSHGVGVKVWLNADDNNSQVNAIKEQLNSTPLIKSCTYIDHEDSYKLMESIFSNEPVISSVFTPSTTPTIFSCVLSNPNSAQAVNKMFSGQPGVMTVQYPQQEIKTIENITSLFQVILLGMAGLMLLASLILIFVTIRMAIFSRRREVAVMKLVGATNWFIRVPFMLEGLIEGTVGALVASGLVYAIRNLLSNLINKASNYNATPVVPGSKCGSQNCGITLLQSTVASGHDVIITSIVLIVIGAIVGVVGSFVAIRRFLDV